ncbi:CB1 cannabinoid receptor-interacting protein 1-like [Ornithodoros turicata]
MGDSQGINFKTVLSLQREGNSEVHYKSDGTRFGSESTIKLNVETPYLLTVCFRPAQLLDNITLLGTRYTPKEKSRDHSSSTYCISWSSLGVPVTKHGKRDKIPLVLEIRNIGELLVNLQAKFYKQEDTEHATWGTALHFIDLDCIVSASSGNVIINKESFR